MEKLYIHLKEASLSPIGDRKPSTKREFRASFIKRCKNQTVNDRLHLIRTLNSTLKVHFPFHSLSLHCFCFLSMWFLHCSAANVCKRIWISLYCYLIVSIQVFALFLSGTVERGRPAGDRAVVVGLGAYLRQVQRVEGSQWALGAGDLC